MATHIEPTPCKQFITLDLEDIDPYTNQTFETIKDQCISAGMTYYVCIVREDKASFVFDAEMFIRDRIKRGDGFRNPLTQRKIEAFSVYAFSKEEKVFHHFMEKEELDQDQNHLRIYWNSPDFNQTDRIAFLNSFGEVHLERDPMEAIAAFEKAAELGSLKAMSHLYQVYQKQKDWKTAAAWLEKLIQADPSPKLSHIFLCARLFQTIECHDKAFAHYLLAAEHGNCIGIMEVIQRLEGGHGVQKNMEEASKWRAKLPEKWQQSSAGQFFKHLQEIQYTVTKVGYP